MPTFYMLVGLPASGKTTLANSWNYMHARVRSSDDLRDELLNDTNDMSKNAEIFDLLHSLIKADLYHGYDTMYDATNLNSDRRKEFLKSLTLLNCKKICLFIDTPSEVCDERNLNRDRIVPVSVMTRMKANLQIPMMSEGWNEIRGGNIND